MVVFNLQEPREKEEFLNLIAVRELAGMETIGCIVGQLENPLYMRGHARVITVENGFLRFDLDDIHQYARPLSGISRIVLWGIGIAP